MLLLYTDGQQCAADNGSVLCVMQKMAVNCVMLMMIVNCCFALGARSVFDSQNYRLRDGSAGPLLARPLAAGRAAS